MEERLQTARDSATFYVIHIIRMERATRELARCTRSLGPPPAGLLDHADMPSGLDVLDSVTCDLQLARDGVPNILAHLVCLKRGLTEIIGET